MAIPDFVIPDPRRIAIRLSRALWIFLVTVAVLPVVAAADDSDDDVIVDDGQVVDGNAVLAAKQLVIQKVQMNKVVEARLHVAGHDSLAARMNFDSLLTERFTIVDRVCELTEAQWQKLRLASRGDYKRLLDRAAEIEAFRSQWQHGRDELTLVETLVREAELLERRVTELSIDDTLSIKVLDRILTSEQRSRYEPLRAVFRAGGFVQLRRLAADEVLEIGLRGSTAADDGLALLSNLPKVQILTLDGSNVTDDGLSQLNKMNELKRLELHNTAITDAGLMHLAGMAKLEWLTLDNTRLTSAGLGHLKRLTNLKCLLLSNTQVTDAGLAHLKGMTRLRRIQLRDTPVTDRALVHLKGLTALELLGLSNTRVTDAGVAEFKRSMPSILIDR